MYKRIDIKIKDKGTYFERMINYRSYEKSIPGMEWILSFVYIY